MMDSTAGVELPVHPGADLWLSDCQVCGILRLRETAAR